MPDDYEITKEDIAAMKRNLELMYPEDTISDAMAVDVLTQLQEHIELMPATNPELIDDIYQTLNRPKLQD